MARILLIEDDHANAELFQEAIASQGHTDVTWIVGVKDLPDGTLLGIDHKGQLVRLNFEEFQLALVDGYVKGDLEGWRIVARLPRQLICIGMSNDYAANVRMGKSGARTCYEKLELGLGLIRKTVLVSDLLKLPPRAA